jgi:hypothetical protein
MDCEQYVKVQPPLRASAIAMSDPETDCILAETKGTLRFKREASPARNLATGVFSEIFSGRCIFLVSPGSKRYSENVLETSSIMKLCI